MARIRGIVFDQDGVLYDTEPLNVRAEQIVCREYGLAVPESEWQNFKGKTNRAIFTYIMAKYGHGQQDVEVLITEKRRRFLALVDEEGCEMIEGARDFLNWSRANFARVALVTSSSRSVQAHLASYFRLERFFDVVVTGDDVTNGKPDPEPYQLVITKLGVPFAEELCVIEDSDNGVRSANIAGCLTIGLTTSFPADVLKDCGADFAASSYRWIRTYLESIHGANSTT